MTLKSRFKGLLARLPKRFRRPSASTPLALTEEETAAILTARFQKQIEEDGAPLALWQALAAAKEDLQQQVRRATLILAGLQMVLALVLGILILFL